MRVVLKLVRREGVQLGSEVYVYAGLKEILLGVGVGGGGVGLHNP